MSSALGARAFPGAAHARALVKACDLGGPGKAQLTLQEVELARSNAVYGEFVKWLLEDRAREFKRRAVEMALGITELTAAFVDFQALRWLSKQRLQQK